MVGAAYAQVWRHLLGVPWKMVRTATSLGFRVWAWYFLLLTQATAGRRCQVLAHTPHKVLGPGIDGRGIPRGPRHSK